MAERLPLGPIDEGVMVDFLVARARHGGQGVARAAAQRICGLSGPVPYDIQRLSYEVFDRAGEVIEDREVEEGMGCVIRREDPNSSDLFSRIPLRHHHLSSAARSGDAWISPRMGASHARSATPAPRASAELWRRSPPRRFSRSGQAGSLLLILSSPSGCGLFEPYRQRSAKGSLVPPTTFLRAGEINFGAPRQVWGQAGQPGAAYRGAPNLPDRAARRSGRTCGTEWDGTCAAVDIAPPSRDRLAERRGASGVYAYFCPPWTATFHLRRPNCDVVGLLGQPRCVCPGVTRGPTRWLGAGGRYSHDYQVPADFIEARAGTRPARRERTITTVQRTPALASDSVMVAFCYGGRHAL